MKLKNILSIICCLVAMASCSMEDDMMGNSDSGQLTKDTYLSVKVATADVITKAGESHPAGEATYGSVNNCYYFILDGNGEVLNRRYVDSTPSSINFLVKMNQGVSILAVVNCDDLKNELDTKADKAGIMNVVSSDAGKMVKVGEESISWTGITGSPSTAPTTESTVNVSILVKEITALVSFDGFYVRYKDNIYDTKVRLTAITLSNLKGSVTLGGTEGALSGTKDILTNGYLIPVALKNEATINNYKDESSKLDAQGLETASTIENLRTSVFPNATGDDHLTMTLTFTVNGRVDTRTYVINPLRDTNTTGHNYVQAGYWYKMNVILNITAAGIESLEVVPWNEVLIGGTNGVEFK
ncbi:hypothetical protein [Parabacteroides sp. AF48-14]|uniref:hypothetical protein n=1 Tax=Parabacteroides sp. AF48-14 TaxID=2292052 RepID=UPI000EFE9932|nr:hypothetical protein [Parabacteroides sp. AF48-14]